MPAVPYSQIKQYNHYQRGGKIEWNQIFEKGKKFLLPAAAAVGGVLGGRYLMNRNKNKDINTMTPYGPNQMMDPNNPNQMMMDPNQPMNFNQYRQDFNNQVSSFRSGLTSLKNRFVDEGRNQLKSRFNDIQEELASQVEVQKERLREKAKQYDPEKYMKKAKDKLDDLKIEAINEGKKLRQKGASKASILKSMAKLDDKIDDEKDEAAQESLMEGSGVSKSQRKKLKKLIYGNGILKL